MKKYNFRKAFFYSFFSKDFYQDVAKNWKGFGFNFLIIIVTICWFLNVLKFQPVISDSIKTAKKIAEQFPEINIIDGKVKISETVSQPYFIKIPGKVLNFMVIDTTDKIESIEQIEGNALFLLTKDKLIYGSNSDVRELSNIKELKINKEIINHYISLAKIWLLPILYICIVTGMFIFHIIQVLLYGLLGMVINKFVKTSLKYKELVRISVMSIMPVFALSTLRFITGIKIPYLSLIGFFIAMGYIYFGISANKESVNT